MDNSDQRLTVWTIHRPDAQQSGPSVNPSSHQDPQIIWACPPGQQDQDLRDHERGLTEPLRDLLCSAIGSAALPAQATRPPRFETMHLHEIAPHWTTWLIPALTGLLALAGTILGGLITNRQASRTLDAASADRLWTARLSVYTELLSGVLGIKAVFDADRITVESINNFHEQWFAAGGRGNLVASREVAEAMTAFFATFTREGLVIRHPPFTPEERAATSKAATEVLRLMRRDLDSGVTSLDATIMGLTPPTSRRRN